MKTILWIEGNRTSGIYTPRDEICLDIRGYFASGLCAIKETKYDGIILNPRIPFMVGTDAEIVLDVEEDPEIQRILREREKDPSQWWKVPVYFIQQVKKGDNRNTPMYGFQVCVKKEEDTAREQLLRAGMQELVIANGNARADLERILQRF